MCWVRCLMSASLFWARPGLVPNISFDQTDFAEALHFFGLRVNCVWQSQLVSVLLVFVCRFFGSCESWKETFLCVITLYNHLLSFCFMETLSLLVSEEHETSDVSCTRLLQHCMILKHTNTCSVMINTKGVSVSVTQITFEIKWFKN